MSNYAREKLRSALLKIATSEGSVKERLETVFQHELSPLQAKDFPIG